MAPSHSFLVRGRWARAPVAAALGLAAIGVQAPRAAAASTPPEAVDSFIAGHDQGCPRLSSTSTVATPTYFSEVTAFRPAGFDVRVVLQLLIGSSGGTGLQANFLVAGPTVYPYDAVAAQLASGCSRDPGAPQTPLEWHGLPYDTGGFGAAAGPHRVGRHGPVVGRCARGDPLRPE